MKTNKWIKWLYRKLFVDENEKQIKLSMQQWFRAHDEIDSYNMLNIDVKTKMEEVVIEVLLSRPGEFIGYKGKHIAALRDYLQEDMDIRVVIQVIEGNVFWHKNTTYYHKL